VLQIPRFLTYGDQGDDGSGGGPGAVALAPTVRASAVAALMDEQACFYEIVKGSCRLPPQAVDATLADMSREPSDRPRSSE
jgi:hypothetical protein